MARKVYGLSTYYHNVFTVVATTESGTKSIEDLRGKAIGVTDLGGGEIPLVNAVLADAGLEPGKDVELKVVGPGGATAFRALKDGEVAAFGGAINDLVPLESQGLQVRRHPARRVRDACRATTSPSARRA